MSPKIKAISSVFLAVTLPSLLFSEINEDFSTADAEEYLPPSKEDVQCFRPPIEWISEQNVLCKWQGKSQSATVDKGFVVSGNYLYWQAREGGLEYLQKIDLSLNANEIVANAKLLEPNFEWNSGFKLALGYIFSARSQWDVRVDWSSFHSEAEQKRVSQDPNFTTEMLRSTWFPFLMGTGASQGSVHWLLCYNILNGTLGRDFFVGKWISFHPQIGVSGGWIHQHYSAAYQAFSQTGGGFLPLGPTKFQADWGYRAVGIRLGTDIQWYINSHLSIVANGFASILYGRYKLYEKFQGAFFPVVPTLFHETVFLKDNYYRLRPVIETELGLRWQHFFSDGKRRFLLGSYYGFAYWFQQNIMVNEYAVLDQNFNSLVIPLPALGDLQLQGLRIEAELNF